jgi:iron complex transport system substrate-binding protein
VPSPICTFAAAIALVALVTACGDDGGSTASTGTTVAPTTTEAPPPTTTAAPADGALDPATPEGAAATAYALVFDSTVAFDEKAPHLEDAAALQETVEKYTAAGQSFNGIKLTPTAVMITSENAAVTYDVYFGTTQQYAALAGAIENRDGTWTVTRAEFCGFMASARTPCPA